MSRSARSVSSLSLRVSPMPTSSPLVVGTLALPASASHASLRFGFLLGLACGLWAIFNLSPVAVVSSISPWETVVVRRRRVSSGVVNPALECGSKMPGEEFDFRI